MKARYFTVLIFLIACLLHLVSAVSKHGVTIIVSFDAFYYKYFDRNITPTLTRLKEEGTRAKYMINIFPTKTYPNHFSIATGRYAEEHGVLENHIFDPTINKSVEYSEELFCFNKTMLPIWALNEKAGDGRHSGVLMWTGLEYTYQGFSASFKQRFNFSLAFKERVDMALKWITDPKTPANLIMLYFEEPDTHGHVFGPDSEQVNAQLTIIDNTTKYLIDKLNENKITNYNLVMLSDHGMSVIDYSNIIDLNQILSNNTYDYYGSSPTLQIYPKPGKHDEVLENFRKAANRSNSHFRVFTKEEIPDRWRYKKSPRVSPMLLLADNGYVFSDIYKSLDWYHKSMNVTYGPGSKFGAHGYDPQDDNMHPFFFAHGPAFKHNHTVEVFNNVDLYSLFAHVLKISIKPDSHSGNFSNVVNILEVTTPSSVNRLTFSIGALVIAFLMIILILTSYACYITITKTNSCMSCKNYSNSGRRRNWNDIEYTALEDYHLLAVLSESDDNTM
ncbi:ectonucleotide pyrophosphatase/phosphodiesterase family member 5-like [Lycorma delicatula]|uniref:ectonucleotide pyrophosphatase/phosphodiesterase family member 5-like n=1 Tax=Lycorma delicatula TaxID=130591 RepID=UPI003F50F707